MHGLVLHVLMALFVFASLNACRILLVDALCRVLWRELFTGHFEFMANCDDCGVHSVTRHTSHIAPNPLSLWWHCSHQYTGRHWQAPGTGRH